MGTIPAPNIAQMGGEIAQAPANSMLEYARAAQLRQATAMEQQQTQQAATQNQMMQQQLADNRAMTAAMQSWDGQNMNQLPELMRQHGISAQGYLNAQQGILARQTQLAQLDKDQLANMTQHHNVALGEIDAAESLPDEQLSQGVINSIQKLQSEGHLSPQEASNVIQHANSMPPDQLRPWLDIYRKGLMGEQSIIAQANKEKELATAQQTAQAKTTEAQTGQWKTFPELGVMVNVGTGEQKNVAGGGMMSPSMMESKYIALQQRQNAGLPLDPGDRAWMKGFEKYKTLVPAFNINQQLSGGGLIPPGGPGGAANGVPPTIESVPASISPRVKAILDYRAPLPPAGRSNPVNNAINYWVNALDPQHDETNFPARNKLMTAFTSGNESRQINAINTAMGHIGVLGNAIDALNNGDVKLLNKVANGIGAQIGATPKTTFETIVHRVGPELAAAYIQGGGGEGERGTTADDFSPSMAPEQLKSNVGITARLLRSKIGALENQYRQTMGRDDFQQRFITPEAQNSLNIWGNMAAATKMYLGHTYEQQSDGSWKLKK